MQMIIDVPEKLVCEGFERPFTEEERDILIRAIGNGRSYNPQGDLISREELKKELEVSKYIVPNDLNRLLNSEINRCIEAVDNAHAVEQNWRFYYDHGYAQAKRDFERPQGEWVVYGKQGDIPITDRCTNCNYEMKWYKTKYHFCPNCGAAMRKGDTA